MGGSSVDWISSSGTISSQGCESGWTVYLEEVLEQSPHVHSRQTHFRRRTIGTDSKDEDYYDDYDDDSSMVSDASSGPPHFSESEPNDIVGGGYNNYDSFINYNSNPGGYGPAGSKTSSSSRSKSSGSHVKSTPSSRTRRRNCTNRTSSLAMSSSRSSRRTEDDYLVTVSNQHPGSNLHLQQQQQQQQLDDTASSPFYGPCYKVVMKNGEREEELRWM